ncbi:MAG: YihY/virulence factor BrkB family protein [Firmicutes bacterium]|nr:YihY/virulence factor BrkB family protein [Bacillota bacterium]
MEQQVHKPTISERIQRLITFGTELWQYCSEGVWNDTRKTWKVNLIKTANLSITSFLDQDLQSKSCALTYRTLLAIVPALALLCAIGRGFGLQELLKQELIKYLPSQAQVLQSAFGFVDSYLSEASGGVFVGVGIIFLLWTLISLLSCVEDCFNTIWQVIKGRQFWRKVTDYLAIFIVLPVLMICASGLSLFMTTSLKTLLPFSFIDSALSVFFDCLSVVLSCLFFAGSYMLIPNTKVKPVPALISGAIVGTAFQILQWVFVSGQMYVAKYNAIYGSFSFLPLMLIWLQLVWLFTLIGGVMCYASQNISEFNFSDKIKKISTSYMLQITLMVMGIISNRFVKGEKPMSAAEISLNYNIPINLMKPIVIKLHEAGLINYLHSADNDMSQRPLQPAMEVEHLTVGDVSDRIFNQGENGFLPDLDMSYPEIVRISKSMRQTIKTAEQTLLVDAFDTAANTATTLNKTK